MKKRNIFWGIALLAVATLIILDALGKTMGFLALGDLPIVRILLGIAGLYLAVRAIINKRYCGCVFPLAFVFLLFEGEIATLAGVEGGNLVPNWTVLIAALLMTIGIAIIFPNRHSSSKKIGCKCDSSFSTRFESSMQYIDCADFIEKTIENNLGSCTVHFANTDKYIGGGVLNVYNNLGSVTVKVPEDWTIVSNIENNLGSVTLPSTPGNGPTLHLSGENDLGSITVKRV